MSLPSAFWRRNVLLVLAGTLLAFSAAASEASLTIEPAAWRVVQRESGPVSYYSVVTEGGTTFVHSRYVPPLKTVVLGWQVPDADRSRAKSLKWTWRARTLPKGGDECRAGLGDSAAVVYVTWKHMLRYYTLKYVWSAVGTKGAVCDKKRNPFVAQDTVVVDSGPPLDTWRTVDIDLAAEFRKHFADGAADAEVPDFVGIGIMSDGDQTHSESSADYGRFVLERR